jgi:hypothetical protein
LAWEMLPGGLSGRGFEAGSLITQDVATPDFRKVATPGVGFDELVVDAWLHVEQQDAHQWWMNIAGVTVHVCVDRDGKPTRVTVDGPDDYDAPVPGCAYELRWSSENLIPAGKESP